MKNQPIIQANADAGSPEFKQLVSRGFSFLLEIGNACADPRPGMGYFCQTIEDARQAYRSHKAEGELFSVKAIHENGFDNFAQGWTA